MPTRDDILRDLTFKEEGNSVARRVADTLFGPEAEKANDAARLTRIAKAISAWWPSLAAVCGKRK